MRRVFADSVFWVALASPNDQWHARAIQASRALGSARMITTQEIFIEFLAHFSGFGRLAREGAVHYFESVLNDPEIVILPQTPYRSSTASLSTKPAPTRCE